MRLFATLCKSRLCLLTFTILACTIAQAQTSTFRVMTYNLLQYPARVGDRAQFYTLTIEAINPDVIALQELKDGNAIGQFKSEVVDVALSTKTFTAAAYTDGPDTKNGFLYNNQIFTLVTATSFVPPTGTRQINLYSLKYLPSGDTIDFYVCHLKASNNTVDANRRFTEVSAVRNLTDAKHSTRKFVILGDFNIYGTEEPAYQELVRVSSTTYGHFVDPLPLTGDFGQAQYAPYHTQSPRTRQFGGGANGGMDDRFDMILTSHTLADTSSSFHLMYGTTTAFGNDGQHYNDSINSRPNQAVSDAIADALHYGSDHIPVYADFKYRAPAVSIANAPKPTASALLFHYSSLSSTVTMSVVSNGATSYQVAIYDLQGRRVASHTGPLSQGTSTSTWSTSTPLKPGIYSYVFTPNRGANTGSAFGKIIVQ